MLKLAMIFALLMLAAAIAPAGHAQVAEPTTVMQRFYCVAGDQPVSGNYFLAGSVDISAQSFDLWCAALY